MPRTKVKANTNEELFETRLARFRKDASYSQRDLARETGISQRMIAYYEKQPQCPPMHVMTATSKPLGVTTEELLGLKNKKASSKPKDMRTRRRLQQIEELDEKEKRQVIQLLDTFIENNRLKQAASS